MLTRKEMKDLWNEPIRQMLAIVMAMFTIASLVVGMVGKTGPRFSDQDMKMERTCRANSIFELLNVPYRIGCELVKERWKDDN